MKNLILCLALVIAAVSLCADAVSARSAQAIAEIQLQRMDVPARLERQESIIGEQGILAYVHHLAPRGYIVVCADDGLPPVLAWSRTSDFRAPDSNLLEELVTIDLQTRLVHLSDAARSHNLELWRGFASSRDPFQQWPPPGYSPSGGWLQTEWTQNAPYNNMCPLDPVTGIRSIAGCPAVAMAQILNYHQTINGISFHDADDYYHSYAGRNYWIDDDADARDFPTWTELNAYLHTMMQHYKFQEPQTNEDKAALVFACGVAAHQVYSSGGSGTFAVSQIFTAFQRFNFQGMELITDAAPDFYTRMRDNVMDGLPVHLAVVTPAWDAGHNVVVDGYNTDDYYHLNFGWGGAYSGWYLLPSQIPYNLTVIEGAVVDIVPSGYLFAMPEVLDFTDVETVFEPQTLELINITDATVQIEAIVPVNPSHEGSSCMVELTHPDLPLLLPAGQSLFVQVQLAFPVEQWRDPVEGALRIIHEAGVLSVPILVDSTMFVPVNDPAAPAPSVFNLQPNPFGSELTLKSSSPKAFSVSVYNLRGQKLIALEGKNEVSWNGRDDKGDPVGSGVYLLKIRSGDRISWVKALKR